MTPEKQRIAIAESIPGWTTHHGGKYCAITDCPAWALLGRLFDPLIDFNAINEIEKTFEGTNKALSYIIELKAVICRNVRIHVTPGIEPLVGEFRLISSTAAQRAEAYLRTIGKWEDE